MERITITLSDLDLSSMDVKVYVYLAKKGPKTTSELVNNLKISQQKITQSLKKLQSKKLVSAKEENIDVYSALTFEKVLELVIKNKIEQTKIIEQTKKDLVENWKSMDYKENS